MRRREIFIELTSLLDVILIMLFVLLTQARTQTADALAAADADRARAAQLAQEAADAREEAERWQRQVLSDELVLDHSLVVTVSVASGGLVRVEREGADRALYIPYDWTDDTYAANRLRSELAAVLREADGQAVFLVFQYDRGSIYRAEYALIEDLLRESKLDARQRELTLSILELDTASLNHEKGE